MNQQRLNRQTITVQNKTADCEKLFNFLSAQLKANKVCDEIFNELKLAAEEVFVNIVHYAFTNDETHSITIELAIASEQVSLTFIDAGIPFNPLTDSNKTMDKDDLSEGGMGIPLIRSLTDNQEYSRIEQRNVFTVTKHYTK